MRTFAIATLIVALASPALAATVDEIAAANRAASGGAAWDGKQTLTMDIAYSGQGLTGTVTAVADLTKPRWADRYTIGPASGGNGYDGSRAWDLDASGQVTYQDGGEQRQTAVNEAYRRSNMLWKPDHGGAQITVATHSESGHTYDVLTITPKDGKPFDEWFDAQTHMAVRVVEKQGTDTSTTTLSDYKAFDGVQLPTKFVNSNGTPKYDSTLTVTKAAFGPALPDSAYAIPTVTKMDFSIAGGAHETTVPFHLVNNHIYADVTLNGKGPYRLLVDTGGVNVVTPTVARELGLAVEGHIEGSGTGEGRVDTGVTKVAEVRVGNAVIKDQVFFTFPFEPFSDIEGVPQNGLIGYEVFRRFVARVDYGKSELTLIDPKYFDPKTAGTPVPFVFTGHIPTVKGEIDGIPGDFQIDTGARGELTITDPFSVAHHLRSQHAKGVDAVTGWGVGGASRGYVTYLGHLKLGGITFDRPVVTLANEKRGSFGDASFAGNVGGGLLKQYVVTFDYGHQTMYFAPGGIAERDGYDRAGLWFNRSPNGFSVKDVTATSPADQAGLKTGDTIVTVDGKPAKDVDLPALRRRLRTDAPGTVVHFGLSRSGGTKDVAVTLRDLI